MDLRPGRPAALPALAALLAALLATAATAHPEDGPALAGSDLFGADAALPGDVAAVPWTEGPLCGAEGPWRTLRLGEGTVRLAQNATHVGASVHLGGRAFVALAAESGGVVRSLVMMQEQALVLHEAVGAVVEDGEALAVRAATAGVPVDLPSSGSGGGHGMEGAGDASPSIEYGAAAADASCADGRGGVLLLLERSGLALGPGDAMAHVIVLADREVPDFLPHPLESTAVTERNLYLASAGEDADAMEDAFSRRPGAAELAAPIGVAVGIVALAATALRRRP